MKWYQFIVLAVVAMGIIGFVGQGVAKALTERYVDEIVETRIDKRLDEMAEEAEYWDKPERVVEKLVSVVHIAERLDAIPNVEYWNIHRSPGPGDTNTYRVSVEIEQENPLVETNIRYDSNSLLEAANKVLEVLELELISEE